MDAHASSLVSNSSVSARRCFRHRRVGLGMSVQRVVQTTGFLHMLHKCGGDLGMGSLCFGRVVCNPLVYEVVIRTSSRF